MKPHSDIIYCGTEPENFILGLPGQQLEEFGFQRGDACSFTSPSHLRGAHRTVLPSRSFLRNSQWAGPLGTGFCSFSISLGVYVEKEQPWAPTRVACHSELKCELPSFLPRMFSPYHQVIWYVHGPKDYLPLDEFRLMPFPLRTNHFPSLSLICLSLKWNPQFLPCPGREGPACMKLLVELHCVEGHLDLPWYHTILSLCSHSSLCALLERFCTQSSIILSDPGRDKVTWLNDKWASLRPHPLLYLFLPLNSNYKLFIMSLYIIHKSQHSAMNTWRMLPKYTLLDWIKVYIYCYLAAWKKGNWGDVGKHSLVQCQALGEQKISAL